MDIRQVKILIESRKSVNCKYSDGNSLLHTAIQSQCSIDVIQFLLDLEADVNAENALQNNPLHLAVKTNIETVLLLIQFGANIHAININGMTPLHEACHDAGKLQIIQFLIKLKVLNLVQNKLLENWRFGTALQSRFAKICEDEAKKLREKICLERNVKFLDILTKHLHKLAIFLSVNDIEKKLSEVSLNEKFPIYFDILEPRIKKCTRLSPKLDEGLRSVPTIMSDSRMSYIISTKIMSFLSENDLKNLNSVLV